MNKALLTGGAIFIVAALAGAGVMSIGTNAPDTAPAGLADGNIQTVADTGANALASTDVYAGETTPSGGFTGDVLQGSATAPVTVIEYASLTCPHCAAFHKQIYPGLKMDYIDSGKVKFIYRDFPLNNPAIAAAIIARCGGPDRYLAFVDLFMSQQDRWTSATDWMGELQEMSKLGGLSVEQINACLQDTTLGQSVIDRYRAASDVFKVSSTPTLVINGETYTGDLNPAAISAFINRKL